MHDLYQALASRTPRVDTQYENLLKEIKQRGTAKGDRTGTGTTGLFGRELRYDLSEGFPLITTKAVPLRLILAELLWFLSGSTDNKVLNAQDVHIWDEWAKEDGSLGPIYGAQWRAFGGFDVEGERKYGIDQIAAAVQDLNNNPDSRRILVSAWNPAELHNMALPPCHVMFQFYSEILRLEDRVTRVDPVLFTTERLLQANVMASKWQVPTEGALTQYLDYIGVPKRSLSCKLTQRSADMFLGVPFNIASYAALTMMMAQQTGHLPGEFIWSGGDCHIYHNHQDQVDLQLSREPKAFPTLDITKADSILAYTLEHFNLRNYDPHPVIKAPVAV